jgi:hypothetical protein
MYIMQGADNNVLMFRQVGLMSCAVAVVLVS